MQTTNLTTDKKREGKRKQRLLRDSNSCRSLMPPYWHDNTFKFGYISLKNVTENKNLKSARDYASFEAMVSLNVEHQLNYGLV